MARIPKGREQRMRRKITQVRCLGCGYLGAGKTNSRGTWYCSETCSRDVAIKRGGYSYSWKGIRRPVRIKDGDSLVRLRADFELEKRRSDKQFVKMTRLIQKVGWQTIEIKQLKVKVKKLQKDRG